MQIEAGIDCVKLPEYIEESSAQLAIFSDGDPERNPQSFLRLIARTSLNELLEIKRKLPPDAQISGFPSHWALGFVEKDLCIFLWPIPAHNYFAKFRYCPAMKEI